MKKFFAWLLTLTTLITSNSGFISGVYAQEATESAIIETTPSPTPEPTPIVTASDWQQTDENTDKTLLTVAEGKEYSFRDTKVKVKFTKITTPGYLTIKQIKLSSEDQTKLGALSDTAFDITSDMADGSFAYDLTLPNPKPNETVSVKYSEDGTSYQDLNEETKSDVVEIKNLDHFTIFVVTNPTPPPTNLLQNIIDNTDSGFQILSGTWRTSTSTAGYYGTNYVTTDARLGTEQVRWNFTATYTGSSKVFARWTAAANRGTVVPFTVTHDNGSTTVTANQETNNGTWVSLGTYLFTQGNSYSVTLTNNATNANDYVIGDAIKWENASDPTLVYVDNAWNALTSGTVVTDYEGGTRYIGFDAFASIPDAVSGVASGGEIRVNDSATNYSSPVTIDKPLTLTCKSNSGTTINTGNTNIGISLVSGADGVLIKDCKVTGNGDGINADSVSNLTLQNLIVDSNAFATSGAYLSNVTTVNITGTTFSNNIVGLDLVGTTKNVIVSSSTFTNNSSYDISDNTNFDVTATGNAWDPAIGSYAPKILDTDTSPASGFAGQVIYDTTAPAVPSGFSPADGTFTTTAGLTSISWGAVTDDYGPVTYTYQSALNSSFTPAAYTSGALTSSSISAGGTPAGIYYVHVKAKDATGNESAYSPAIVITVDNTAPVISFTDGVNSTINTSDSISISITETNLASSDYAFSTDNICDSSDFSGTTYSYVSGTPFSINTEANNGKYICARAIDKSGNATYLSSTDALNIDVTGPTTPGQIGWTTENPPVGPVFDNYKICDQSLNYMPVTNLWGVSTDAGSGVAGYDREVYSPNSTTLLVSHSLSTNYVNGGGAVDGDTYWVRIRAYDALGNKSSWTPLCAITYDTTLPTVDLVFPTPGPSATSFQAVFSEDVVQSEAEDPANYYLNNWPGAGGSGDLVGDATIVYSSITKTATITFTNPGWYISPEQQWGVQNIHDLAGNLLSVSPYSEYSTPMVPPVTTDSGTDTSWHNSAVTVNLICTDTNGSGCSKTYYTTDGGTPTTLSSYGNTVVLNSDGIYTIKYFSVDNAGNQETVKTASNTVKIDITNPSNPGTPSTTPNPTNVTSQSWSWLAGSDLGSGIKGYWYWVTGTSPVPQTFLGNILGVTTSLGEGIYDLFVQAEDLAGNKSSTMSGNLVVDTTPPTLTSAETQDRDHNGQIDAMILTFNENIKDSYLAVGADGWDVAGYTGEAIGTGATTDDNKLLLTFNESGTPDTAATPDVTYTSPAASTHDLAGNELQSVTKTSLDLAEPVLLLAKTYDDNKNGRLDRVMAAISEDVDAGSLQVSDFDVAGYSIVSIARASSGVIDLGLTEKLANDTGALPLTKISSGGVLDLVNNSSVEKTITPTDKAVPEAAWTNPAANTTISGTGVLEVSASDEDVTKIKSVEYLYKFEGSPDTFHSLTIDTTAPYSYPWDTTSLQLGKYTVKAIVTDNADNTTEVSNTLYVAAVITSFTHFTVDTNRIQIDWTTDRSTDGRIVYDTHSHSGIDVNDFPNYGYAFSTGTLDYGTTHSMIVAGLSDNTYYYFRAVSAGTPVVISEQGWNKTFTVTGAGGGGGGGGTGGGTPTTNTPPATPPAPAAIQGQVAGAQTEIIEPTPEPEVTSSPIPSPTPTVEGASTELPNFNWWLVIVPSSLFLFLLLLWLARRSQN